MEKEEFLPDDLLKDLFRDQQWEVPGDAFTGNVMEQISMATEVSPVKKPLFAILRSSWPYVIIVLVSVLFLLTSDLPFTDYIPGKGYFTKNLIPYFSSLLSTLKPLISNGRAISIPIMVILGGIFLVGFDHFLFRKVEIRHQTTR
jgi:hypothetical protein